MEAPPLPDLLLLHEPTYTCPLTGDAIRLFEAELTLLGPEAVACDLVLGRGAGQGRLYALLTDVAELAAEEGWAVEDVEGFAVNGRRVTAGLVGPGGQVAPWAAYLARMEEVRARAAEPPPAAEAVRALPVLPEAWEAAARGASWIHDEEPPRPAFLAVVVDADGRIRHSDVRAGAPHDAAALAAAVLGATRGDAGAGFRAGRPRVLRVADGALAEALADALAPVGIPVEAAAAPLADEALDSALARFGPPLRVPLFLPHDAAEVRVFFAAARRFYRARPWTRLRGDRYVAVRLGEGPWLYVSVMGQMEEEPGLSLFDSWLRLCRFIHNEATPFALMRGASETMRLDAAGAIEGVTLFPLSTLLPEDGLYLRALDVRPTAEGLYALPVRYTPEGFMRPSFPLPLLADLMDHLVTAVKARRAPQITSIKQTFGEGDAALTLRYPARGDEHLDEAAGAYRLTIEGQASPYASNPFPPGTRLCVEAPGHASLAEVNRALRQETGDAVWFSGFGAGDYYLWHAREAPGTPAPRVADLDGLAPLWLEQVEVRYPLRLAPLPEDGLDGIRVVRHG